MTTCLLDSFNTVSEYIEYQDFKGYDPYDTLNSWFPFQAFGKWLPIFAIQLQKRNPLNIRPLLGIRKDYNPKAMGLLLQAFSLLYKSSQDNYYLEKARFFFEWLLSHQSSGYSGACWGYNFPWATPEKALPPYTPSSVVTGTICKGLWQYYQNSKDEMAAELVKSASRFLLQDLPQFFDDSGLCISYTPVKKDICYNASLLAGEVLAMNYKLTRNPQIKQMCVDLVNFVVARQKSDGRWNYSQNIETGQERQQIDFHQGYVLESIHEIQSLLDLEKAEWNKALLKGAEFYFRHQFKSNGRSIWRYPKEYPVEIHNQSQGIITFYKLQHLDADYFSFAHKIADWTINNMQSKNGAFHYQHHKYYKIKIPYIRWSQAWMFLALTLLLPTE